MEKFGRERWLAIPYNEVRQRHQEVPADKTMIILCDAGTRSYEVQVMLDACGQEKQHGAQRGLQRHPPHRGGLADWRLSLFGTHIGEKGRYSVEVAADLAGLVGV